LAESEYVKKLEDALGKRDDIADWRFVITEASMLEVGMKNNELATPYTPPTQKSGLKGGIYIVWKGGNVSTSSIEPHQFNELEKNLDEWKNDSYNDPNAPEVLQPTTYPDVKVYSKDVADMLHDPSYMFEVIDLLSSKVEGKGISYINAQVRATLSEQWIKTSTGIDVNYPSTSLGFYFSVDSQVGEGDDSRKVITLDRIGKLADRVISDYGAFKNKTDLPEKELEVLLHPGITGQMIGMFLWGHMSGSAVAQNKSRFTKEDFENKKKVADDKLSIILNALEDYDTGSVPCDGSGIPGGRHVMLEKGRLCKPELGVKWSKELGMEPTGEGSTYVQADGSIPMEDMVAGMKEGVLIQSVIGMGSQDRSRGDYSVPTNIMFYIKDGKRVGDAKTVLTGNFFDDLLLEGIEFCHDELDEREVGMKLPPRKLLIK